MTIANISVLLLVVVAGFVSGSVAPENFVPFVPHGLPSVIEGGGLVYVLNTDVLRRGRLSHFDFCECFSFFAYLGFDQVRQFTGG